MKVPIVSHTHQYFVLSVFNFSHSSEVYASFNLNFSSNIDVNYLFYVFVWYVIHISSLMKCLLKTFALFCLPLLIFNSSLYILDRSPFLDLCSKNIFS